MIPDHHRTILIHLNVAIDWDDQRTPDEIADQLISPRGVPDAEVVCTLAKEV